MSNFRVIKCPDCGEMVQLERVNLDACCPACGVVQKERTVNGWNAFYRERFEEMCAVLECGIVMSVYIDCIGHTRNNMTQEEYRRELVNQFGGRLKVIYEPGYCSYSYKYLLDVED